MVDSDSVVGETVSVVPVPPATLLQVLPPSVDTCHCTVGVGLPVAAAVNVAAAGAVTVTLVGFDVTTGVVLTVSAAGLLAMDPKAFVKIASYSVPL